MTVAKLSFFAVQPGRAQEQAIHAKQRKAWPGFAKHCVCDATQGSRGEYDTISSSTLALLRSQSSWKQPEDSSHRRLLCLLL